MMKQISVNSLELMQATDYAQLAVNGINTALEEWSSQGEISESLEAFAEQFYELERTLNLYQKLLRQDLSTIKNIGMEFFLTDYKLTKLWRDK